MHQVGTIKGPERPTQTPEGVTPRLQWHVRVQVLQTAFEDDWRGQAADSQAAAALALAQLGQAWPGFSLRVLEALQVPA